MTMIKVTTKAMTARVTTMITTTTKTVASPVFNLEAEIFFEFL